MVKGEELKGAVNSDSEITRGTLGSGREEKRK